MSAFQSNLKIVSGNSDFSHIQEPNWSRGYDGTLLDTPLSQRLSQIWYPSSLRK
jgi:hypothetical protein